MTHRPGVMSPAPCLRGALMASAALLASFVSGVATRAGAADFNDSCSPPPRAFARLIRVKPSDLAEALAVAAPGESLELESGAYGAVEINRSNASFVRVEAGVGQAPVLSSLRIRGSHWIIQGVTVRALSGALARGGSLMWGDFPARPPLIQIQNADNIVFDHNRVMSAEGVFPWREEVRGAADPDGVASGIGANNATCVSISYNSITNVFNGIQVGGDQIGSNGKYFQILDNKIDNFAGDGIDHSVSYAIIKGNIITNGHDICKNLCVHTDGIQGWNYRNNPGITNYSVYIESNTIIQQTDPRLVLPADDLHGITIYDGFWKDVRIVNNVIVTSNWTGIAEGGADGAVIMNNTVAGTTSHTTALTAGFTTHQGGRSNNTVVRNNIVPAMRGMGVNNSSAHLVVDHNLVGADPRDLFVKFDVARSQYDLHPKAGSPSVGHGSADMAPPYDRDGNARVAPIDLGAYQHTFGKNP